MKKTLEEIKDLMKNQVTGFDAGYILRKAEKEISQVKNVQEFTADTTYYKAMTLFEFDKGVLLLNSVPDLHKVFALDFNKNLQLEYKCETPSEKSLAEVVTVNFVRILELQRRISNGLGNVQAKIEVEYLAVLSKELDRAQRHYLTSLQMLKTLHMPSLEVNIHTQTAVVGQNQMVQTNTNDKAL